MRNRRQQREHLQEYRNRDYVQHFLHNDVFEALVELEGALLFTCGCLDALESLPAGGMQMTVGGSMFDQILYARGVSTDEIRVREALAERLIQEILDEDETTH